MVINKKGAMFGLDARIALAIFGALSVISGAALYSAIQESKAVAILVDMKEIGKAWDQYYLDTGVTLPQVSKDNVTSEKFYTFQPLHLLADNGLRGWKGPYLNYKHQDYYLKYPNYEDIFLQMIRDDTDWGDKSQWQSSGYCTSGTVCYFWVNISGFKDDIIAKIIDYKVDGGDGPKSGDFRWWKGSGVRNYRYHLKISPIKNPND